MLCPTTNKYKSLQTISSIYYDALLPLFYKYSLNLPSNSSIVSITVLSDSSTLLIATRSTLSLTASNFAISTSLSVEYSTLISLGLNIGSGSRVLLAMSDCSAL